MEIQEIERQETDLFFDVILTSEVPARGETELKVRLTMEMNAEDELFRLYEMADTPFVDAWGSTGHTTRELEKPDFKDWLDEDLEYWQMEDIITENIDSWRLVDHSINYQKL